MPAPGPLCHSGLTAVSQSVKMRVVPLPSERCTATMGFFGSAAPGLSFWRRGSLQSVMAPRKMPAAVSGVRCSPPGTPSRL